MDDVSPLTLFYADPQDSTMDRRDKILTVL